MPFRDVAASYQPEQLARLIDAFNRAWPTVYFANRLDNAVQSAWLRKRLADYILACASRGEFDPARLAEQALRALNKHRTAA